MVGVARIELATPAMSTRGSHGNPPFFAVSGVGEDAFVAVWSSLRPGSRFRMNQANPVDENGLFRRPFMQLH